MERSVRSVSSAFGTTSGGGPHISIGLINRFFAPISEFGKKI